MSKPELKQRIKMIRNVIIGKPVMYKVWISGDFRFLGEDAAYYTVRHEVR